MIRILTLTTSYPTSLNSSGGIFIRRLLSAFPCDVYHYVLTPAVPNNNNFLEAGIQGEVCSCAYGPGACQTLFHVPGGGPSALKNRPYLALLIPFVLVGLFLKSCKLSKKVDVVHAHWTFAGVVAVMVGGLFNLPVVITLHGQDVNNSEESILLRFMLWFCVRFSSNVVAVSSEMYQKLIDRFPSFRAKIVFISNGVGDDFLEVERKNRSDMSINFLTVSSLIPSKCVDVFIMAMADVLAESDGSIATIVGEGAQKKELMALVENLGLKDRVFFRGLVRPEEMPSVFSSADVYVSASCSEGRPSVVMEAMATGLPLVLTDIPGHRELLEGSKQALFTVGDLPGLVSKLKEIASSKCNVEEMAEDSRSRVGLLGLTWASSVKKYLKLYEGLLGNTWINK